MSGSFLFRPLEGVPRRRSFVAFDIEGVGGPGGFVCGAIVGELSTEFYTDRTAMFAALLEYGWRSHWLFAHSLEYDLPIVAGEAFSSGRLLFKRSGLLSADYHKGRRRARFLDSLNLFPRFSVADLGDLVGLPKLPEGVALVQKIEAGARWRDFSKPEQQLLRSYCLRDAEIVYVATRELQELLRELGSELRSTIGAVSMDLFRRRYMRSPWLVAGEDVNRLARLGFYGGRTENFAVGRVPKINLYDTNSFYPYLMVAARFPHPNALRLREGPGTHQLLDKWEGVAAATVSVPETWTPVLPQRLQGRLFFPTGHLVGVWPICELREALEGGAQLIDLAWVLGSAQLFSPFDGFVKDLYQRRVGYLASKDRRAQLLKLILVNLYGRFGLNYEPGLAAMVPITSVEDLKGLAGFSTFELDQRPVAIGPLPDQRQPNYVNVLISAQITAAGRLHLHQAMTNQGEKLVYTDTDSIMTLGSMETGESLGQWRQQVKRRPADLLSPKEYRLHNKTQGDEVVVKGVPSRLAEQYLAEGSVRYQRALKVREAIASGRNPSEWVETMRTRGHAIPKRRPVRSPEADPRGWSETEPWDFAELLKAAGAPEESPAAPPSSSA